MRCIPNVRSSTAQPSTRLASALLGVLLASAAVAADKHDHGAAAGHVHGQMQLELAVDGGSVQIHIESPLDSLLGFEHLPKTPAQKQAVAQLQAQMKDAGALFRLDAAAGCTLQRSEVESAIFEPAKAAPGEHMDLDLSLDYQCRQPQALKGIETTLFAQYPRLQRIDVQIAAAKGQRKLTLKRPNGRIALQP